MQANPVKFQFMYRIKDEEVECECTNVKMESQANFLASTQTTC